MKKYLDYLNKENVKFLILGLILSKVFEVFNIKFYIGIGVLYCVWLVLNFDLRGRFYFKRNIKIKHKDICK